MSEHDVPAERDERYEMREKLRHLTRDPGPLGSAVCALLKAVEAEFPVMVMPDKSRAILDLLARQEAREGEAKCSIHLNVGGALYGCVLPGGHAGPHDFRTRPAPETREPELTFRELRRANVERRDELLRVKRPDFRPEHAWSLNDWLTALAGEVGEVANLLKKVHRGDFTLDSVRDELAREIGDVQTYLDLLAYAAGIDLGAATAAKWNEVSVRVGLPHRIGLGAPAPKEAMEEANAPTE